MKQKTKHFLAILLLNCMFITYGFAQRATHIPDDPTVVPADFGTTKTTILVVNYGRNGIDKYLEKDFSKNYKGEYVIIDKDDLNNKEYKDLTKYRYIFKLVDDFTAGRFTAGGGRDAPEMNYHINFIDRSNFITYKTLIPSNMFSKLVKSYIDRLNEKIEKNGTK
ncbi:MAG: hypothetical protein WCI49_04895 [Ferruginibacter sp.]